MSGLIKFLAGAAVTIGFALLVHAGFGVGNSFIDRRENAAQIALGEAEAMGVTVTFDRSHGLTRNAVLTGSASAIPPATRARLLAALAAVPGVATATWHDSRPGDPAPPMQTAPMGPLNEKS